jgi:hypothetical protein
MLLHTVMQAWRQQTRYEKRAAAFERLAELSDKVSIRLAFDGFKKVKKVGFDQQVTMVSIDNLKQLQN